MKRTTSGTITILQMHSTMIVKKYEDSDEKNWENLVARSKNPAFIYFRKFLHYHKNTFDDHSIVVYLDNIMIAAIPASVVEKTWSAHPGLPFVDLIMVDMINLESIKKILTAILDHLKKNGFEKMIFKVMPQVYKSIVSDEWIYFLREMGAKLYEQKLSTAIPLAQYNHIRKDIISEYRQTKRPYEVVDGDEYLATLYKLMCQHMEQKYQSKPIHSLEDLSYLKSLFPTNIRFLAGVEHDSILGGAILFVYDSVVKLQYLFCKEQYLGDVMLLKIVASYQASHQYIDLGTSNSLPHNQINFGNLYFKTKNGGKAFVTESYVYTFS